MTRTHHRLSPREQQHAEAGVSMVATLLVVIILGILMTIVISSHTSTPPANTGSSPPTTQPQTVAAGASEATLAACEANYVTLESAVITYQSLHGAKPPTGTAWATGATGLVQSWPNSSSYAITWNGTTLSVVPRRGLASHGSVGSSAPKSGCYAAS